jgi:MerR family redox-sensitive transcriptional activator SoxR
MSNHLLLTSVSMDLQRTSGQLPNGNNTGPQDARQLSIGEVARRAGVRTSTIRYYESVGLLSVACRRGGQRQYEQSVLRRLAAIRVAQAAGFTIGEIGELFSGFDDSTTPVSATVRTLATRKLQEVRALARRAQEMERWLDEGLRCDCLTLEQCRLFAEAEEELASAPSPPRWSGPRTGPRP